MGQEASPKKPAAPERKDWPRISVRVHPGHLSQLQQEAAHDMVDASVIVRRALRVYLKSQGYAEV